MRVSGWRPGPAHRNVPAMNWNRLDPSVLSAPLIAPLIAPLARLSHPVRGVLWMLLASAAITGVAVVVRHISSALHPLEVVFFRNFMGLVFILPWFARTGAAALRTQRIGGHVLRAVFGLAAMTCWFWSVSLMPVADATAFTFTAPLFATLGAAFVLKEAVGPRRWSAVVIGFIGTLIILRPGAGGLDPVIFVPLTAALFMAAAKLTVKSLSRTEMPDSIVLYMGLFMTPLSLVPAAFVWQWPSLDVLAWLAAVGLLASVAQRAMARAFASADASAVMPVDFSRLVFAAVLGLMVFGEMPDRWTWLGAGVIFAATWYTAHRESRLRAKQIEGSE